MELLIELDAPPLKKWTDGTIRVGETRIKLETIITAHHQNESPEEIAYGYPAVPLKDIYAVIAYYLRHKDNVDAYIAEQYRCGEEIRRQIEKKQPSQPELKARLLARKAEMEAQRNAGAGN